MEAKNSDHCKIRKRGNSSSSSSSLVQRYRFKRAILVGKRGGSSTPVPTWMTSTKSPSLAMLNAVEFTPPNGSRAKEVSASVSARKLAATLWEINKIPSPENDLEIIGDKKEMRSRGKVARLPHLSDPSYYAPMANSERIDRSRGQSHRRRTSIHLAGKLHLADYNPRGLDSTEAHRQGRPRTECILGIKTRLKDVSNGLTTSKELLKVLNHICGLDRQHSTSMSLVSAILVELDRACIQVDQFIKEQRANYNEIQCLVKHFEEEKAAWKNKERDKVCNAITCITEELEVEKKLRRQTERLNKKLGKELADMKTSLLKAMKELESEKRAKEILEQVCDELAKGIGEDRAAVEELKKESLKVREEVEQERAMLQLADVLREERVQMKLSEAKYHFEEKNAVVERLRDELEAQLQDKIDKENGDGSPNYEKIEELEAYLNEIQLGSCQKAKQEENEGAVGNGEVHEGDDSADSDLHSIELNMDNNSRSYKWSYSCNGNDLDNPRLVSSDNVVFKGRQSISDNIQWGSISLERKNPNGIKETDRDFNSKNQESSDTFDRERLSDIGLHSQTSDHEDEIKRYKSVKTLKEHILSGSKIISTQILASPMRSWGQSFSLRKSGSAVSEISPV